MKPEAKEYSPAAYRQIEGSLRAKIEGGHWPVGTMLPSRRNLAKEYGVSPITIERAVTHLIAEGMLRTDDRRGTFVAHVSGDGRVPVLDAPPAYSNGFRGSISMPAQQWESASETPVAARTIGIIASLYLYNQDHLELNNFWVRLLVQSLEHAFSEDGKTTQFFNRVQGQGLPVLPLGDSVAAALADGVDALAVIAFGMDPQEVDDELSALDIQDIPVVCITSGELRRPIPHVFFDNQSAGYQAARHLHNIGSRNILFLAPFMSSWVKERLDGVCAAVEHLGLPAETVRVYPRRSGRWVQEEDPQALGYEAAAAAFDEGTALSGVVCVNDGVAFGFLQAAAERGLLAGTDFSVVSFDDRQEARTANLTSLRPPMEAMGREASRLLLQAVHGEQIGLQVRLRWHLIPRASTRPIRVSG